VSRKAALLPALLALAMPAIAGEFRLFLEGEAGVRNDGEYSQGSQGSQGDRLLQTGDQAVGRAGLNLQLSYHRERLDLAMGYSPAYERGFDHPEQLSGLSHRLDFGLVGDLSRQLKLSVRELLFASPTRDLYAPAQADTAVVPRQGDQLVHSLNVALDAAVSRRASVRVGVSQGVRTYQGSGLADSRDLLALIGASFELERDRQAEVTADVGRYDYGELGDASVRTFGVAWATGLGKSSRLRLEAGGYSVDSRRRIQPLTGQPGQPGQPGAPVLESSSDQGWRGSLQLARDQRSFHWTLGLSHDVSPGAGLGRAAKADNAFLGISTTSIDRRLTLALDVNGSRQRDVSSQLGLAQLGTTGALTEYAAGTASASWSFGPGLRVLGGYSRIWQRSRVEPFPNLSYGRYFLNLAFRIFSTGETPRLPERLGEPTHEEPDAQ
jgi:hypothetical protein